MKDQLISFETAKLAKEKGFNIHTSYNCWVKLLDDSIIHNSEREDKLEHERTKYYLSQPSQSLLQKWLREKYNIQISILFYDNGSTKIPEYKIEVSHPNTWDEKDEFVKSDFNTYEKALEIGLKEALKLIKND
jgi:hypothetical protein